MASDRAVETAAQRLLKGPHESIIYACEVLEAPPDAVPEQPEANRVQATVASRRYLALVRNTETHEEEAAIVVFRRPAAPLIVRVIPILKDFQLSISQKQSLHSPTSARERSRFCITFALSASSPPSQSFTIVTEDIAPLAELIAELKRLLFLAQAHNYHGLGTSHVWANKYVEEPTTGLAGTSGLEALDQGTLARFHSISSAYSMRMASLKAAAPTALRAGLSSIDWGASEKDAAGVSAEDIQNDERGRWIVQQLQERESTFTQKEEIKVFVGTFNVNDQLPSGDLSSWLVDSEGAELLVFGFQEFDLTTEAMVRYTPFREDQWRLAIESALGDRAPLYEKLHSRQLVGALIIIYVLKSSSHHVTCVSSNSLATGILGLMANKGACAIRLRYKDSTLTFVNSHLAAFTNQTEKRNQEYRVELPRSDVLRMVEKAEWDLLLRFDQLKIQKQHGLAWTDFEESPITFPPTYKFDKGTSTYDTSEKQRTPSWTDRVLWLSVHDGAVKPLSYNSHPEITLSDHKPVSAVFNLQILTIIPDERIKVQQEVMAELDKYESDQLPDVKILPGPAIQFDTIECYRPVEQKIEVKNVGLVIAQWSFVLKPGTSTLSEPWLHISPTSGLILPGERSIVSLTIDVGNRTAPLLNFSTDPNALSDLLVLSIEKKDLFLSVAAREYKPTCFANSLSRLVKLGKPIRTATNEELDASELVAVVRECLDTGADFPLDQLVPPVSLPPSSDASSENLPTAPAVPVDRFSEPPIDADIGILSLSPSRPRTPAPPTPVLPSTPASPTATESSSDAREHVGIHSVADCLVLFLESLPEPVVTFAAYPKALRAEDREDAFRVIKSLPSVNANTILYIIAFLRVLVAHTLDENERIARIDRLAVVFSSVLMRSDPAATPDTLPLSSIPRRRKAFVLHLLSVEEKVAPVVAPVV
ncbi:hypothetical protein RQP46_003338 [Phenoliferia psychrophenolica]